MKLIKDICTDISRLTEGYIRLEKESVELKKSQAQTDLHLTSKISAHIQPIRDKMKRTFSVKQSALGTEISNLKQFWTTEQEKRELERKKTIN